MLVIMYFDAYCIIFSEMKEKVGMLPHDKEDMNKKMPTPRHKVIKSYLTSSLTLYLYT